MPNVVKGTYLHHTMLRGFVYKYTCPNCDRKFTSAAPELTEPSLCHNCYSGHASLLAGKRRRYHRNRNKQGFADP
jgi:Zn finger protein HypA/HybF involved in hydrogenase expression